MGVGQHFVVVGAGGKFAERHAEGPVPADVDAIVNRVREDGVAKVVLHFHGGLVSTTKGVELARRLERVYGDAGTYPVMVVWESGLLETVSRNLDTLNRTKLFNKLVDVGISQLARLLGAGIGAKGAGSAMSIEEVRAARASDAELERMDELARGGAETLTEAEVEESRGELELALQRDLEDDPELDTIVAGDALEAALLDDQLAAALGVPGDEKGVLLPIILAKLIGGVVINGARRFVSGRDHGVIPTVVEEVLRAAYLANGGAWVWSGMKTAAGAMWRDNGASDDPPSHVGSYLLAQLADVQAQRPWLAIDLVGHSAGSIAIAGLLEATAIRHRTLRFRNLLLLAPALTIDQFEQRIHAHADRFDAFRMFAMEDALECRDRLVPGVYPRSLLYLVSGALEDEVDAPLLGLRRHTCGQPPYDDHRFASVRRYLDEDQTRLVLSKTAATAETGLRSVATRHGDFDDDPVTLGSLIAIIAR